MLEPELDQLLREIKRLSRECGEVAERPLGCTGEIAELEAVRLLPNLERAEVRQKGYDAVRQTGNRRERVQIKGRCVRSSFKQSQRVGALKSDDACDSVLLVLLDDNFDAHEIFEATYDAVERRLDEPGSRARNDRRTLSVSQFKSIATRIWPAGAV